MRKFWRRLKARITGVKPCSYTSASGHDFHVVGRLLSGTPLTTLFAKCSVCGVVASIDRWSMGWELRPEGLPDTMEAVNDPGNPHIGKAEGFLSGGEK